MKLSIIIPYYRTLDLTYKLLNNIEKQITDEVEVIVVDDGCEELSLDKFKKCKIIHNKVNGGLSVARNTGVKQAKGDYIAFIDSDDDIADDYISQTLNKIDKTEFDCCYFGWKAINRGWDIYIDDIPPEWNWAVWNAIYKRELVEDFEGRKIEDVPWQIKMRPKYKKVEHLHKILYYYNDGRVGSITDLHHKGLN